ncbi:hypothetical protein OS128_05120 [Corynebacterium sp. P5848]|uniref:hypothetical protein n=1 Tax=Corynebacterium marambiense TaxID=2765364 RepID=UPI002260A370|nr:hypothetical protein [Corynebacterium marambiense]MCX7542291.1 hypothetical protein [Corynebacterium marambiense]
MTLVSGNLSVVTGSPHLVREVWVRAATPRAGEYGAVITDANARVEVLEDGDVFFDAAPGRATLVLITRTPGVDHVTQRALPMLIPLSNTATLGEVVAAGQTYDGQTGDRIGALAEKIAGYKTAAETALASATKAANRAVAAANEKLGDGAVRLKHLHQEVKTLIDGKVSVSNVSSSREAAQGTIVSRHENGNISIKDPGESSPPWVAVNKKYADKLGTENADGNLIPTILGRPVWAEGLNESDDVPPNTDLKKSYGLNRTSKIFPELMAIAPGTPYYFQCWIKGGVEGSIFYLELTDEAGQLAVRTGAIGAYGDRYVFHRYKASAEWTKVSTVLRFSNTVTGVRFRGLYFNHTAGEQSENDTLLAGMRLVPLPPDGSLTREAFPASNLVRLPESSDNPRIFVRKNEFLTTIRFHLCPVADFTDYSIPPEYRPSETVFGAEMIGGGYIQVNTSGSISVGGGSSGRDRVSGMITFAN